jgi:hypothetical protein
MLYDKAGLSQFAFMQKTCSRFPQSNFEFKTCDAYSDFLRESRRIDMPKAVRWG